MLKTAARLSSISLALTAGLFVASCSKEPEKKPAGPETPAATESALTPETFLAENGKKADIITLPSGLQYKIIQNGAGASPKKEDYITVNYIGRHIDGTEFDNSYRMGKSVTIAMAGVIPGWAEALPLMKEGTRWELYVPAKLGFGKEGVPDLIAPDETLIFDVELVKVQTAKAMAELQLQQFKERQAYKKKNETYLADNKKKPKVVTTASGLQYEILRQGSGKKPKPEDTVEVNYRGMLIDGQEFDSSYARGESASFKVQDVIKGWTEALQMMKEGSKFKLYIPAELAYGAAAPTEKIQPYSTLVFEVELLKVK